MNLSRNPHNKTLTAFLPGCLFSFCLASIDNDIQKFFFKKGENTKKLKGKNEFFLATLRDFGRISRTFYHLKLFSSERFKFTSKEAI